MQLTRAITDFFRLEATGGLILLSAAAAAIGFANSPATGLYDALFAAPVTVSIGAVGVSKPLLLWINDGLMAVFFLLVGLEIKREFREGELSSLSQAALPGIAALGGMVVPALCYVALNLGDPDKLGGWAIPSATDIAFALGVLALLGDRIPASLKIFLMALAVLDDLGAILVITIFYNHGIEPVPLGLALVAVLGLIGMNFLGVKRIAAYMLVGLLLWLTVLESGIHATLAGVVLALTVPLGSDGESGSPLHTLEHALHPWVAYGILPLFAFANAGVPLAGFGPERLLDPVVLGIAAGLFLGKQIGVLGFVWGTVRLGWASLPDGASWMQIYGVAVLTGIGFTMSLFIGSLAFEDDASAVSVRIGVILGSFASAALGYGVLRFASAGPGSAEAATGSTV
jgi:NhaA family Na+:H+ antiporter